jgi:Tfp pilus assembly protein PilE
MIRQFTNAVRCSGGRRDRDLGGCVRCQSEAGYTFIELIVAVWFIGILTTIAIGFLDDRVERAKLAACMLNLRSIQSTAWAASDEGIEFPRQSTFWHDVWKGKKPGPYYYLTDNDDPNAGHGNDIDDFDEQNPGDAPREDRDIHFVVLCQHDHRNLCRYVFIEDEGPPIRHGWDGGRYPNYHRFLQGNPGGGGIGGTEGAEGVPGGGKGGEV